MPSAFGLVILIVHLLFGWAGAALAKRKHRRQRLWFILCFFFSLVGLSILALKPPRSPAIDRIIAIASKVPYLPLLLLALAWEVVARLNIVDSLALPPLSNVAVAWVDLVRPTLSAPSYDGHVWDFLKQLADFALSGDLLSNGVVSLYRGSAGLLLAIMVGGSLGMAMARWRMLDVFVNPLVELFYPLPKSALIPVTVIWLGFGDGSKILLIFLGCMIPITIGAYNGARGSEQALVWSARSMGASRMAVMRDVVMPSALPELLNGIRTALALAFILLVSSELIVSQEGFGYLIGYLGSTGSYEGMYAVVLTVAFLGFAADRLYQLLIQWLLRWRE
jgi:NitT/TauT family transport system permease protein